MDAIVMLNRDMSGWQGNWPDRNLGEYNPVVTPAAVWLSRYQPPVLAVEVLGVTVRSVSRTDRMCDADRGGTPEQEAMIDLAGAVAESRVLGHRVEPHGEDIPTGSPEWIEQQWVRTEVLVQYGWPEVCQLTVRLLAGAATDHSPTRRTRDLVHG